jgi:hypothetical protein
MKFPVGLNHFHFVMGLRGKEGSVLPCPLVYFPQSGTAMDFKGNSTSGRRIKKYTPKEILP